MFLLLAALGLGACTRQLTTGLSPLLPDARLERVFIATQRSETQWGVMFGERRRTKMSFYRYDVSIPPVHRLGRVERIERRGIADPRRHFAPVSIARTRGFAALMAELKAARHGDGGLLLFVPGYNGTVEDGAFRLAQIGVDFDIRDPLLLFSWPSAGDPRGYVYDRDSVLFARDGFERLLRDLDGAGQRRILLVAHSMGGHLVMEVLRQIALKGDRRPFRSISGVVLMSPDIDPDVFREQARDIGVLPQPFVIMTSREDRILGLASLLTGRKPRLGRIDGPEAVEGLDVTVLDFSVFTDGTRLGHDVPFTSATAIRLMRGLRREITSGRIGMRDYVFLGREPGVVRQLTIPR